MYYIKYCIKKSISKLYCIIILTLCCHQKVNALATITDPIDNTLLYNRIIEAVPTTGDLLPSHADALIRVIAELDNAKITNGAVQSSNDQAFLTAISSLNGFRLTTNAWKNTTYLGILLQKAINSEAILHSHKISSYIPYSKDSNCSTYHDMRASRADSAKNSTDATQAIEILSLLFSDLANSQRDLTYEGCTCFSNNFAAALSKAYTLGIAAGSYSTLTTMLNNMLTAYSNGVFGGSTNSPSSTYSALSTYGTIYSDILTKKQAIIDTQITNALSSTNLAGKTFENKIDTFNYIIDIIGNQTISSSNKTTFNNAVNTLFGTRAAGSLDSTPPSNFNATYSNGQCNVQFSFVNGALVTNTGTPTSLLPYLKTRLTKYQNFLSTFSNNSNYYDANTYANATITAHKQQLTKDLSAIDNLSSLLTTIQNKVNAITATTFTNQKLDDVFINPGGLKDFALSANANAATTYNSLVNIIINSIVNNLMTLATT